MIVNGSDLFMWLDDELIGSSTSYTLTINTDAREITNKGSARLRSYKPGLTDIEVSCDGLVIYEGGKDLIYDAMFNYLPVKLEFGEKTTGDVLNVAVQYYAGYFIVTSLEQTAGDQENATYSATFKHSEGFRKEVDIVYPYLVTYFVDATGGDDGNDGLSESTAWQTLTKVNNTTLIPGDAVLFKRGETFRGYLNIANSGTSDNWITLGAYGTGAKPKIWGSKDYSNTNQWEVHDGNIWKTVDEPYTISNCANVIFNNEDSVGVKKVDTTTVLAQGDWCCDSDTHLVYLYSVGNPGSYYTHIEIGGVYSVSGVQEVILLTGSYIRVQYLDVRYSENNAIIVKSATGNIIIEHNDVAYAGGGWVTYDMPKRWGNGIGVWSNSQNITIRYNYVRDCFDAGISPQGSGTFTQQNIQMYYNIVVRCYYSYEVWAVSTATNININFDNNTCYDAGNVWSNNEDQRPDYTNARHIMIWDDRGTVTNCNIRNNIFSEWTGGSAAFRYGSFNDSFKTDYNLWDVTTLAITNSGTYVTLANWQASAHGLDQNSVSGDPMFMSTTNYHLRSGSPAINSGLYIGLTKDYDNVNVNNPPEIGAYEY